MAIINIGVIAGEVNKDEANLLRKIADKPDINDASYQEVIED